MSRTTKTNGGGELSIKNEILGIVLLFSSLFLAFSLISYTPLDPSFFSQPKNPTVFNFGGRVGSEVAALLFNLLGYASLVLVFFSLFFTAFFLCNRRIQSPITKTIGFFLLLVATAALLAIVLPTATIDHYPVQTGGLIGMLLGGFFTAQLRQGFAVLLAISLIAVSLVLIAKISIRHLLVWVGRLVFRLFSRAGGAMQQRAEKKEQSKQRKRIEKKYPEEAAARAVTPEPPVKSESRTAVRNPARVPSKMPEESYLFADNELRIDTASSYNAPLLSYLDAATEKSQIDGEELENKKNELQRGLEEFRIGGKIVEYTPGPLITTYEFVPSSGIKVKDVAGLTEDLALAVKAPFVRIERIIGKGAIGIEVPNKKREIIHLREMLESRQYRESVSPLTLALGKTATGGIYITDLREMPHLIVAGSTGSGKSVAIHTIILSILYKSPPKSVKFLLIDPKGNELIIYNSLPHLLTPVVVNPKHAHNALDWVVWEMEQRYKKLATLQVRDLEHYNKKLELLLQGDESELENLEDREKLHYIVVIIDELADLMITSGREIEEDIARIAQKARAVGIHLILATQRPSVDVITGTIKNNFSSRIALRMPTKADSRTIIDQMGAEKLLGNGDMLFLPPKTSALIRLHCAFVSEEEAIRVVQHLAKIEKPEFNTQIIRHAPKAEDKDEDGEIDDLFFQAAETVIATGQASASFLQRRMSVGYARAGRLMDQLQDQGVVSAPNNKNQREVLMTAEELQKLREDEANPVA